LNGEDLGYVPRNDAAELAPKMDAGQQVAEVDWLNSPTEEFQRFGLKVSVGITANFDTGCKFIFLAFGSRPVVTRDNSI